MSVLVEATQPSVSASTVSSSARIARSWASRSISAASTLVRASLGQLHHDAAAIVERWVALDRATSRESVDAVGHGARGHERLLQQLSRRQAIGLARSPQCGEHVELPTFQAVPREGLTPRTIEVPRQAE